MADKVFRCSSLGRLMTEPKTLKEGPLSVGAKTYIREIAQQDIFGIDFEIAGKPLEKGNRVEDASIQLLNRVRGLSLVKNTERRTDGFITGECDLFDAARRCGHDMKNAWSAQTFPAFVKDCEDKAYEWQMHGYMALWPADEWEVNYCLMDTPEDLIGYEPLQLHVVSHIPEHMRLTTWVVKRDQEKIDAIREKVRHARAYYAEVINDFDRSHVALEAA